MAKTKRKEDTYYLVTYRDAKESKIVSLKARSVTDSSLGLSFVCLSQFIFHTEGVVVDPHEEQMKSRYENIKNLHLSLYSIVTIEEVGVSHKGLSFQQDRSNLLVLPQSTN